MKNLQKLVDLKYEIIIIPDWLKPNQTCVQIRRSGKRAELFKAGECAVRKLIKEIVYVV